MSRAILQTLVASLDVAKKLADLALRPPHGTEAGTAVRDALTEPRQKGAGRSEWTPPMGAGPPCMGPPEADRLQGAPPPWAALWLCDMGHLNLQCPFLAPRK